MEYKIRLIDEKDAPFIISLRNNPKLNKYLNQIRSITIQEQISWIREYKYRENLCNEYYFVVYENGVKKGLSRLYNIDSNSFTFGSWLFENCENLNLPILTDLLMGDIGFHLLNKKIELFDVIKENKSVLLYHSLKKPLLYQEDTIKYYYKIKVEDWDKSKKKIMFIYGISDLEYNHFSKSLCFNVK